MYHINTIWKSLSEVPKRVLSLDEGGEDKIKIVFYRLYMMISTFCFTYEGNSDLIFLVMCDEAIELNKRYSVIQGNQIFKISDTNVEDNMYIIAKGIEAQIMNPNEFDDNEVRG